MNAWELSPEGVDLACWPTLEVKYRAHSLNNLLAPLVCIGVGIILEVGGQDMTHYITRVLTDGPAAQEGSIMVTCSPPLSEQIHGKFSKRSTKPKA